MFLDIRWNIGSSRVVIDKTSKPVPFIASMNFEKRRAVHAYLKPVINLPSTVGSKHAYEITPGLLLLTF